MLLDITKIFFFNGFFKYFVDSNDKECGFRGSSFIGCSSDPEKVKLNRSPYDCSHSSMVYTALCSLLILGDDLSRIDRHAVVTSIASLQSSKEHGLLKAGTICHEKDVRFIFSGVASCYILNGLDALNCDDIVNFVIRCQTYQGGFGLLPGLEAHAGATYCALAVLSLIGKLDLVLPLNSLQRDRLIKWLVLLQNVGYHGRIGKLDDTCYTFWVCASLKILNCQDFIDKNSLLLFIATCWDDVIGAIKKYSDYTPPDPLHNFLCLSGLGCLSNVDDKNGLINQSSESCPTNESHTIVLSSEKLAIYEKFKQLLNSQLVQPMNAQLNIPQYVIAHLDKIHQQWNKETS